MWQEKSDLSHSEEFNSIKAEFLLILTVSNWLMLSHGISEAASLHFKFLVIVWIFRCCELVQNPQNRTGVKDNMTGVTS